MTSSFHPAIFIFFGFGGRPARQAGGQAGRPVVTSPISGCITPRGTTHPGSGDIFYQRLRMPPSLGTVNPPPLSFLAFDFFFPRRSRGPWARQTTQNVVKHPLISPKIIIFWFGTIWRPKRPFFKNSRKTQNEVIFKPFVSSFSS